MTTDLDPIFVNNSQLFKVSVYDVDGVTPLAPQSCVCDVFNKDTGAQIISATSGLVGTGYAQYNWAGSATPGNYEAELTVTISVGVVKSERFHVSVLGKPTVFTLDENTDIGTVRMIIQDVDPENALFSDAGITKLLNLNGSDVRLAAAAGLDIMASSQAMILKVIRTLDLTTDGAAVARALREHANQLRADAEKADAADEGGLFDYAEIVTNAFTERERMRNQILRGAM
jgi:hypothetical protein